MRVRVVYSGPLHQAVGKLSEELELKQGTLVSGVLGAVCRKYGQAASQYILDASGQQISLKSPFQVFCNGKIVDDFQAEVSDGDSIAILLPLSGGGQAES